MRTYLLLGQHDLPTWRSLSQTTHQARFARLQAQAESYFDWLPPDEHPSESITYIGMAVANLALTYLLTEDTRYMNRVQDWLDIAINYPHWGKERMPDHDLDAAWLLFGLGLGYDWLKDDLPSATRDALLEKLHLQGQRLYDFAIKSEGRWWSSAYWQNHNWICYAGLATVAYAMELEYPETQAWADRARDNFRTALALQPEDGAGYEGPVYWRYGFPWFLIYSDLLQQQTGEQLHNNEYLRNAFWFRLYVSAPNLIDHANLGDCHDRRSAHSAAVYYRLASLYNIGEAQWLADHFYETGEWAREGREGLVKPGVLPEAFLELLWYNPAIEARSIDALPLMRIFPDMGLASVRTSWDEGAAFLVFKCGTPSGHKSWAAGHALDRLNDWDTIKASHEHPDENSFILVHGADYLAVDEGYSNAKSTRHHNTVLVDGQGQYREGAYNSYVDVGPTWGGRLEEWFGIETTAYLRGEAALAYDPALGLERFTRQVVFVHGLTVICDDLVANEPRVFEWLLQTDAQPVQQADGSFVARVGETNFHILPIQPINRLANQTSQEITANPTSAQPDWVVRREQHTLALRPNEACERTRFLVVLSTGQSTVHSLAGAGDVMQIGAADECLIAFARGARGIHAGEITSDARWLHIRNRTTDTLSFIAGSTTRLWCVDALRFVADYPVKVARMRPDANGCTWIIQSDRPTWVGLWTPHAAAVLHGMSKVTYDETLALVRGYVPAGEHKITLK